jgi:hypothetical protein
MHLPDSADVRKHLSIGSRSSHRNLHGSSWWTMVRKTDLVVRAGDIPEIINPA